MAGQASSGAGPLTTYVILEEHHLQRGGRRVFKSGFRFGEQKLQPRGDGSAAR